MARRVFFSFYYERDIWRANQVGKSPMMEGNEIRGFWDASLWQEARESGDDAVRRMIDAGLEGTSVTVVLIGHQTHTRRWVTYEIEKSRDMGNGLLGVHIHNLRDAAGEPDLPGRNPLDRIPIVIDSHLFYLSQIYPTYDWVLHDGCSNIGEWIENAAKLAGRA